MYLLKSLRRATWYQGTVMPSQFFILISLRVRSGREIEKYLKKKTMIFSFPDHFRTISTKV